jgi:hypothetical protein
LYAIKENKGNFNDAKQVFSYLSKVYLTSTKATNSFVAMHINSFTNSFEHLCSLLLQSGVKLPELASSIPDFEKNLARRATHVDYLDKTEPIQFIAAPSNWVVGLTAGALDFKPITGGEIVDDSADFMLVEVPAQRKESPAPAETLPPIAPVVFDLPVEEDELVGDSVSLVIKPSDDSAPYESKGTDSPPPVVVIEKMRESFTGKDMIASIVNRSIHFDRRDDWN